MTSATPLRACSRSRGLFAAVVLEGELYLGAVGTDVSFFQLHVELDNLGDAQVTQAGGSHRHGRCGRLLPGIGARADEFDDLVDALCHDDLLGGELLRERLELYCIRAYGARILLVIMPGPPSLLAEFF